MVLTILATETSWIRSKTNNKVGFQILNGPSITKQETKGKGHFTIQNLRPIVNLCKVFKSGPFIEP